MRKPVHCRHLLPVALLSLLVLPAHAQQVRNTEGSAVTTAPAAAPSTPSAATPAAPTATTSTAPASAAPPAASLPSVEPPGDYVIGPEDVLGIVFWRDRDLSADVIVRPDGRISLPLLNDVDVAGLTPDQVRAKVVEGAKRYVDEPTATVVVRQINSRKVFITGNVERPGTFPLLRSTTVLQLIAVAGGLKEFAKAGDIVIVRNDNGRQLTFPFNYDDLKNRKNLAQNIVLKPGDTVIVP
jgi:polysaccharide export outer membrane protein